MNKVDQGWKRWGGVGLCRMSTSQYNLLGVETPTLVSTLVDKHGTSSKEHVESEPQGASGLL